VTEYLNLWESVATGVNMDVLDFRTMERLAGGNVLAVWTNYYDWIVWRREVYDSSTLFQELQTLATRIAPGRGVAVPGGEVSTA